MASRVQEAAAALAKETDHSQIWIKLAELKDAIAEAEATRNTNAIELARVMFSDDDCEIDDDAITSESGDGGTWVAAWLYVPPEEISE